MAETSTIYTVGIDLADIDRNRYEQLELRVARHPSETAVFMLARILAYCMELTDGIEMTPGVSSTDLPAIIARDLTGRITTWIEIGMPDAERLHRGSRAADRTAVYTHRDVRQLLAQLEGRRIHRAEALVIRAFDRVPLEQLAERLERRMSLGLTIAEGELLVALGSDTYTIGVSDHRIQQS